QLFPYPQSGRCAALPAETDEAGLPHGVRDCQVNGIRRRDAETDLPASQHLRLGLVEQPVLGELLEVPVGVACLAVEAHRPGPGPADDPAVLVEVLPGLHSRRAVRPEPLDVEPGVAAHPDSGTEGERLAGRVIPPRADYADAPRRQRREV